jgi:hypothetical protein
MRKIRANSCDENFPGSDYRSDEVELFKAVERYKHKKRLRFVSVREVLEIVKSLGYRKVEDAERPPTATGSQSTAH